MTERLDALMTRSYQSNGETKTAYTKIGVAFPLDGGGYRLKLESVPVPTIYDNKIECSMLLVPPRDRDSKPAQEQNTASGYGNRETRQTQPASAPAFESGSGADDIPFMIDRRL